MSQLVRITRKKLISRMPRRTKLKRNIATPCIHIAYPRRRICFAHLNNPLQVFKSRHQITITTYRFFVDLMSNRIQYIISCFLSVGYLKKKKHLIPTLQ